MSLQSLATYPFVSVWLRRLPWQSSEHHLAIHIRLSWSSCLFNGGELRRKWSSHRRRFLFVRMVTSCLNLRANEWVVEENIRTQSILWSLILINHKRLLWYTWNERRPPRYGKEGREREGERENVNRWTHVSRNCTWIILSLSVQCVLRGQDPWFFNNCT